MQTLCVQSFILCCTYIVYSTCDLRWKKKKTCRSTTVHVHVCIASVTYCNLVLCPDPPFYDLEEVKTNTQLACVMDLGNR